MQQKTLTLDPRYFQLFFQTLFLGYGLFFLSWTADIQHYFISIGGCLFFNYCFESIKQKQWLKLSGSNGFRQWGFSVLISAASLCLLLKTNYWTVSLLAAFLTVASKYILRIRRKHLFNPSAFGIVATIVLTKEAWLSPAQWGSNAVLFFRHHYTGYHRSNPCAKARCQPCVSLHLRSPFILATSDSFRLADGLFYSFHQHRKLVAVYLFYDLRPAYIARSSGSKNPLGGSDSGAFPFTSPPLNFNTAHRFGYWW